MHELAMSHFIRRGVMVSPLPCCGVMICSKYRSLGPYCLNITKKTPKIVLCIINIIHQPRFEPQRNRQQGWRSTPLTHSSRTYYSISEKRRYRSSTQENVRLLIPPPPFTLDLPTVSVHPPTPQHSGVINIPTPPPHSPPTASPSFFATAAKVEPAR